MSIKFGTLGEFWAIDYLISSRGYILLFWNYVTKTSQQDLVFLHSQKNKLIFVEVKTTNSLIRFADLNNTLSLQKLNKRKLAAREFLNNIYLKFNFVYEINLALIKIHTKEQNLNPSQLLIEYSEQIDL